VDRYRTSSRDCATYSDYSEEYEYEYDEHKTGMASSYEQEYNPSHLMDHQGVIAGAVHANIHSPALSSGLEGGEGRMMWSAVSATAASRQPAFMLSGRAA